MKIQEWFEKDGMDYERCLGLTGDEEIKAEKAWNACKAECLKIANARIMEPNYWKYIPDDAKRILVCEEKAEELFEKL